jgi:hypothetical protein
MHPAQPTNRRRIIKNYKEPRVPDLRRTTPPTMLRIVKRRSAPRPGYDSV